MEPTKSGQIVKFHTMLEGENPGQQYVVLEINDSRAKIQALNTGLSFPPVNIVKSDDLIVVNVNTTDLLGTIAYILTDDNQKVLGRITSVIDEAIKLDLEMVEQEVRTNVTVKIIDKEGCEHSGLLVVGLNGM